MKKGVITINTYKRRKKGVDKERGVRYSRGGEEEEDSLQGKFVEFKNLLSLIHACRKRQSHSFHVSSFSINLYPYYYYHY
jgi:hypothetical protein